MTTVTSMIHGLYPRSNELAQLTRDVGRKREKVSTLKKKQKSEREALVKKQKELDFGLIEDGKLTWQDIFRPIVESTQGLTVGALTRWFDNNTFFRQPVLSGKLQLNEKKLLAYFPPPPLKSAWKVTLPSPYAFAKLTKSDESFEETLGRITNLMGFIVKTLEKKGVVFFQFNEPYLPYHGGSKKDTLKLLSSLQKIAKARKKATIALHLYFGDASEIIKAFPQTPVVDVVGVDFFKTDLESLPKGFAKGIIAGVVDGRNSLLENEPALRRFIDKLIKAQRPEQLFLANNSDLELLPEETATKKLKILSRIAAAYR